MASGQQRALQELERLQAASDGGFSFHRRSSQEFTDILSVDISLRIGTIEQSKGGLNLRERESFLLLIPANFPFEYPIICVEHDRFADFPHVVWGRWFCIYQSNLEWNPSNGIFGFFERLNLWLGKAAINDMDPVDGPLEPPHGITTSTQIPFIIRANAPIASGKRWLGFAIMEKKSNRMEVIGWKNSFEKCPDKQCMALAVFLPEALPMEFPRKGEKIFEYFEKQGFDRERLLQHLAFASHLTPEGEPSYLIIGLPMRRAAGGTNQVHIAIWSIKADDAKNLRNVLGEDSDSAQISELRKGLGAALMNIFALTDVCWCRVMEDRPEIVVRRDKQSPIAWFRNKRVLILGCGALGSWSAEMVARAGASNIGLVDNGIVKPGLIARQNFSLDDIGSNKALALAKRLRSLITSNTTIESFESEAHAFAIKDIERFISYDIVIDCAASDILRMMLERDWSIFQKQSPAWISMVTDAKAAQGLCVVLPHNTMAGPWDAYVRLKYRLCTDDSQSDIIHSFYDAATMKELFQPEPGCSDPTFSGSMADVVAIVSAGLNFACEYGLPHSREIAAAFSSFNRSLPSAKILTLDAMYESVINNNYRVRIANKVNQEARAWVRQNTRRRSPSYETGGLLWGMWDDATGIIWVFDASGPPPDSIHEVSHFTCGIKGTVAEHKKRMTASRSSSGFVGFWHTHPDMSSNQSVVDIAGMATLVSSFGSNQKRSLMVIFGNLAGQPSAGIYVYENAGISSHGYFIKIGEAQIPLEKAVV